jgi:acid phosphatase
MCDGLKRHHDRGAMPRLAHRLGRALAGACVAAALAGGGIAAHAAECGLMPAARIPAIPTSPLNIDDVKRALKNYQSTFYEDDIAAVADSARKYIEQRAGQVTKPALVLDIDKTSLSNWTNLVATILASSRTGPAADCPRDLAASMNGYSGRMTRTANEMGTPS